MIAHRSALGRHDREGRIAPQRAGLGEGRVVAYSAGSKPKGVPHPGALRLLARRAGVPVVPVSLAYPWRDAPAPALVMRFHAPIAPDTDIVRHAEDSVAAGLDHVDDDIDHGVVPGAVLVAPKAKGTQDGLPARALRRLMGGHR